LNTVGAVLQTTDKGINLSKAEYIEGGKGRLLTKAAAADKANGNSLENKFF